jgi:hypothetical protein
MHRSTLFIAAGTTVIAALAGAATADVNTWTGAVGDGEWSSAGNWSLGRTPIETDDTVIGAGAKVRIYKYYAPSATLTCDGELFVTDAGLYVSGHCALNGGGVVYDTTGNTYVYFFSTASLGGTFKVYGGHLYASLAESTTVQPGARLEFWDDRPKYLGGSISNYGTITYQGTNLILDGQGLNKQVVLDNHGTMEIASVGSLDVANNTGMTFLLNYGTLRFAPGAAFTIDQTSIWNNGTLEVDGASATLNTITNVTDGTLQNGYWHILHGGHLVTSPSSPVRTIDTTASVGLEDAGSTWDQIFTLERNRGYLLLDRGVQVQVFPFQLNPMYNEGWLYIGAGSRLTVTGSFVQKSGAELIKYIIDPTPSGNGILETILNVELAGTLTVEFANPDDLQNGDTFDIAGLAPNGCCGVLGEFENVYTIGTNMPFHMVYDPTVARLRIGDSCRADLDASGTLDLFDFLEFSNLFNAQDPAADFTGDGAYDLFDFLAYVNEFNAGC